MQCVALRDHLSFFERRLVRAAPAAKLRSWTDLSSGGVFHYEKQQGQEMSEMILCLCLSNKHDSLADGARHSVGHERGLILVLYFHIIDHIVLKNRKVHFQVCNYPTFVHSSIKTPLGGNAAQQLQASTDVIQPGIETLLVQGCWNRAGVTDVSVLTV